VVIGVADEVLDVVDDEPVDVDATWRLAAVVLAAEGCWA
jgi:hypothetical protein